MNDVYLDKAHSLTYLDGDFLGLLVGLLLDESRHVLDLNGVSSCIENSYAALYLHINAGKLNHGRSLRHSSQNFNEPHQRNDDSHPVMSSTHTTSVLYNYTIPLLGAELTITDAA